MKPLSTRLQEAANRISEENLSALLLEASDYVKLANETVVKLNALLERSESDEPCEEEVHSWSYFVPQAVDPYWMKCDRKAGHEGQHTNMETGAEWK